MNEPELLVDADTRGRRYTEANDHRRVFPSDEAIAALTAFDEPLPELGSPAEATLALLDDLGSPATTASNGPRYFGFVIGAALPAAAAAERLMLAWDQCASTFENSPVSATLARVAARWMLDALDLPRDSAVGFGTSATACTLTALAAARRELLACQGWDFIPRACMARRKSGWSSPNWLTSRSRRHCACWASGRTTPIMPRSMPRAG